MCSSTVAPEVEALLAELLADMCAALAPDDPGSAIVGPVDFGGNP